MRIPKGAVKTRRPQKVTVQALDENGQSVVVTGEDELEKYLCHELEHLDGIVFLDHTTEEVFFEDE